jgi:hypothetical protein
MGRRAENAGLPLQCSSSAIRLASAKHPLNDLRKLVDLTLVGLGLSDSAVN